MEDTLRQEIRSLLGKVLDLDVELESIAFSARLFDGSIGLDSVDMVSMVVAVERKFEVQFPAETEFPLIFSSIDSIATALFKLQADREC